MASILIVGLGNPGKKYEGTRHNLGFWLVEYLAKDLNLSWTANKKLAVSSCKGVLGDQKLILVKPEAYMNLSGQALRNFLKFYKVTLDRPFIVLHDEVNVPLGEVKLSIGVGAGGHNGVADLMHCFPGNDFVRFRLGVGPKSPPEMELSSFVLQKFNDDEKSVLTFGQERFIKNLKLLINEGPEKAMNVVNQKK